MRSSPLPFSCLQPAWTSVVGKDGIPVIVNNEPARGEVRR
jgi:hypothetical protein